MYNHLSLCERQSLLVVLVTFAVCPWIVLSFPYIAIGIPAILLYSIDKKNYCLPISLLFFMYPSQLASGDSTVHSKWYLSKFIGDFIIIGIIFAQYYSIFHKSKSICFKYQNYLIFSICSGFLLHSFYYFHFHGINSWELLNYTYIIIVSVCFTQILAIRNISIKYIYSLMDVVFVALFFYGVLEFFFNISPYNELYNVKGSDYSLHLQRVKSLCGHPLILVGFMSIYQISLYARLLQKNTSKFTIILALLVLLLAILSFSRTIIYALIIGYVGMLVIVGRRIRISKIILSAIFIILAYSFLFSSFDKEIGMFTERVESSVGSETNRFAAFETSMRIFQKFPMGIGYNLKSAIQDGKIKIPSQFEDHVLDNNFLSTFCEYGIFCFMGFFLIFYPFIIIWKLFGKRINRNSISKLKFWLTLLLFVSLSFSFIFSIYLPLLVILSTMLNTTYRRNNYLL